MPSHLSARYVFRAGGLPDDLLAVVDFTGDDPVSQPFRFVVNLVSTDPDIAFDDVVNEKASLVMLRGDDRAPVHGIVTDFQQGRKVSITLGDRYLYRAVLVPRLQRLAYSHQSRIFQNLTVQEIVAKVLAESDLAGSDVQFKLQGSYSPREYCTQYKETDLDFVQRLLEYEGIRYHFEHGDSAETLVITDDPQAAPPVAGDDTLVYHVGGGLAAAETAETVREFVTHQRVVTGRVVLKDYNYRTPGSPIQTESQLNGDMPGVFYDYGIHVKDAGEGARLAKVRNEEIECQREQMVGASDCLRFRAGAVFSLTEHYREGMNQSYLLTSVRHAGRQPDASPFITGDAEVPEYTNDFVCVPATAPYRPPRLTPEPKIPGVMTAMVESGGGDYAYLDDQGRYRVRMPFDRSEAGAAQGSKAIRLAQPYSGPDYGMHFPVHKGAEMVFACVDGDVDRPLGLSTVPNPAQGSPVSSENRTMNRIVTASDNRIEIEDEKGSERIKLYSPTGNSILQLGAPNLPQSGVGISTDDSFQAYGAQGLVLKAGGPGGYLSDAAISDFKTGLTALDGALGVARAVAGGVATKSIGGALLGGLASIVSTAAGIIWPGVYVYGEAGIGMYSPNGINALAGAGGMGLHSNGGTDVFALRGISLMNAAMGISIINGQGGVAIATGTGGVLVVARQGDVTLEAKHAKVVSKAMQAIEGKAADSEMKMGAGLEFDIKGGRGIWLDTDDKFTLRTKKKISIRNNRDDDMDVHTKDLVVEATTVKINARSGFVFESGSSKLEINPQGIFLTAGPSTKLELGSNGISGKGMSVNLEATTTAKVKATGTVALESSTMAQLVASMIKIG